MSTVRGHNDDVGHISIFSIGIVSTAIDCERHLIHSSSRIGLDGNCVVSHIESSRKFGIVSDIERVGVVRRDVDTIAPLAESIVGVGRSSLDGKMGTVSILSGERIVVNISDSTIDCIQRQIAHLGEELDTNVAGNIALELPSVNINLDDVRTVRCDYRTIVGPSP